MLEVQRVVFILWMWAAIGGQPEKARPHVTGNPIADSQAKGERVGPDTAEDEVFDFSNPLVLVFKVIFKKALI